MNELIDRLAAKASAEIKAMAESARRSIGQRFRWARVRLAASINNREKVK